MIRGNGRFRGGNRDSVNFKTRPDKRLVAAGAFQQLQRTAPNDQRLRLARARWGFINNPHQDAIAGQFTGQGEPNRPGTND